MKGFRLSRWPEIITRWALNSANCVKQFNIRDVAGFFDQIDKRQQVPAVICMIKMRPDSGLNILKAVLPVGVIFLASNKGNRICYQDHK